jgi:hypothetical protein
MIYQKVKNSFYTIALVALAAACNNPKGTNVSLDVIDSLGSEGTDTIRKTAVKLQPCYLATIGKDSAFLKITVSDSTKISGELQYKFHEKDQTIGEISGKISSDTLTVMYTFSSEGKKSEREITFLVRDEQVIEGIGDYQEKGGKMLYKSKALIDYTGKSFVFLPSACTKSANGKVKRQEGSQL